LASNSLLEGLVYGARGGKTMRAELKTPTAGRWAAKPPTASGGAEDSIAEEVMGQVQDLMWKEVGIVRTRAGMQGAIQQLEGLASRVARPVTRRGFEAANIHLAGLLVSRSALAREESRGAHYRTDFPAHDDAKFLKHSVVRGETIAFE
jgi:L-aspartate oxidase